MYGILVLLLTMEKPKVLELPETQHFELERGFCLGEKHYFRMRYNVLLLLILISFLCMTKSAICFEKVFGGGNFSSLDIRVVKSSVMPISSSVYSAMCGHFHRSCPQEFL